MREKMAKNKVDKGVLDGIKGIANGIYQKILKKKSPELVSPLRSLANVSYNPKDGYFEILGKKKKRDLTVSTVKTFAQTLRVMLLSKELVEKDDIATKREAYYVSTNWGDARLNEQPEADSVIDDFEAMILVNR